MGSPRNWRPAFEQQSARINVDDGTWREFRTRCLADGEHVSDVLARLVRAELDGPVSTRERVTDQPVKPPTRKAAAPPVKNEGEAEALSLFDL